MAACVIPIWVIVHRSPELTRQVCADCRAFLGIVPDGLVSLDRRAEISREVAKTKRNAVSPYVKHTVTIYPPRGSHPLKEAMAKAKYDSISLGAAWSGTLEVLNLGTALNYLSSPVDTVAFSALGGTLSLVSSGAGALTSDPLSADPGGGPPGAEWVAMYFPYVLTCGGDTETVYVFSQDDWYPTMPHTVPEEGIKVNTDLAMAFEYTVSDLYPKALRTDGSPATRQAMDWSDFSHSASWYADEGSTVTFTLSGHGVTLSDTASLANTGEIDLGGNPWIGTYSVNIHRYDVDDTVYARISDLEFNGKAVDLSNLELSNPGTGDAPDAGQSSWKRSADSNCARIGDDGGIATWWTGTGNATKTWSGTIYAPYFGSFIPIEGGHNDALAYSGTTPQYVGPIIEYEDDHETTTPVEWEGTKTYYEQRKSWEFEWEYKTLSTKTAVAVYHTLAWRIANGEDLVGTDPDENDRQLALLVHWLDATGFDGDPIDGPMVTLAHSTSLNINDPPGVARPSSWTGSGGVTVNPGDNDEWAVADASSAPKVERSFASRYFLRLDRLAAGSYVPGQEYLADWAIMHEANLAIGTTLDDPDWWDSEAGGVDAEDIRSWADWAYVRCQLTAPAAGTIKLIVDYSVAEISDPCYTCAEHRWAEYSYTRNRKQLSYSFDVTIGANDVLIDLCASDQGVVPAGDDRLQHVDKISMELPANDSGDTETWTLTGLDLRLDPGEGERAEPSTHLNLRYKRAWDWIGADWLGFAAIVDGKDALELDYGYGYTRAEEKLLYIQRSEHCPGSHSTVRLDSLKSIARLKQELDYQEGWTPTDHELVSGAKNKDGDENTLCGALYWFDLRQAHEWTASTSQGMNGAPCVGTVQLLAGIEQHWYYYAVPRGRGHGIAISGGSRQRSTGGIVILGKPSGGSYSTIDTVSTDEHGRWASPDLREKDYTYRVQGKELEWQAVTREYTAAPAGRNLWDPYQVKDFNGGFWLVATDIDGVVYCYWINADYPRAREETAAKPFAGAQDYSRPSIAVDECGALLVCATYNSNMVITRSRDRGHTWSEAMSTLGNGLQAGTIKYHMAGGVFTCGWKSSDEKIYFRASSANDLTADALNTDSDTELEVCSADIDPGEDPPRSDLIIGEDRSIIVIVDQDGSMTPYRCRNFGAGTAFTEVT